MTDTEIARVIKAMDAAPVPTKDRHILSHDIDDPVQRAALLKALNK
jgi:hypothetical protein